MKQIEQLAAQHPGYSVERLHLILTRWYQPYVFMGKGAMKKALARHPDWIEWLEHGHNKLEAEGHYNSKEQHQ